MTDVFRQHGAFSWTELMTTDPEGAKTFYSELFGWETDDIFHCIVPYSKLFLKLTSLAV